MPYRTLVNDVDTRGALELYFRGEVGNIRVADVSPELRSQAGVARACIARSRCNTGAVVVIGSPRLGGYSATDAVFLELATHITRTGLHKHVDRSRTRFVDLYEFSDGTCALREFALDWCALTARYVRVLEATNLTVALGIEPGRITSTWAAIEDVLMGNLHLTWRSSSRACVGVRYTALMIGDAGYLVIDAPPDVMDEDVREEQELALHWLRSCGHQCATPTVLVVWQDQARSSEPFRWMQRRLSKSGATAAKH